MICSNCGQKIADESFFCPHCGQTTKESTSIQKCPSCASVVKGTDIFCNICGYRLKGQPPAASAASTQANGAAASDSTQAPALQKRPTSCRGRNFTSWVNKNLFFHKIGASLRKPSPRFIVVCVVFIALVICAAEYLIDVCGNIQSEYEIKKDMQAKSSRILGFGAVDADFSGSMTALQIEKLIESIRQLAAKGVEKSDFLGFGEYSLLGGHHKYCQNLEELKTILCRGTDLGLFDSSISFARFERRFKEMVEAVQATNYSIQIPINKILSYMASIRQTTGITDANVLAKHVKDLAFTARVTGKTSEQLISDINAAALSLGYR